MISPVAGPAIFAHELNQPLTAITSYAHGTLRRYRSGAIEMGDFAWVLELVVEQAQRAGSIIRNIRQFIQKEESERRAVDVNAAIREATGLVQNEALQCNATIELELQEGLPSISGDSVHLPQVVLYLARNGLEATRDSVDGDRLLSIRTAFKNAVNVEIIVEDSGPGMPADICKRMFDSFFTTKDEGMGMGLSICRSIIDAHGGKLSVDEEKKGGAAFRFVLPAAENAEISAS